MSKGMKRFLNNKGNATFKIQITSMVDMFVLLLIFLLMNYSTDKYIITSSKNVTLPESTSDAASDTDKVVSIVVGKKGIYIEDDNIIEFQAEGRLPASAVDEKDPSYITKLFERMDQVAEQAKTDAETAAAAKPDATKEEFSGRVLIQADRSLPYDLIRKVMYTSMLAGFSDVRLAVVGK
jgi:biopolymer transport protein ExbD